MPRRERNRRAASWDAGRLLRAVLMRARCGRPSRRYSSMRLKGGAAERNDALLVALAADLHASGIEREVAGGEAGELGDAEAAGIEQFKDGAIAQRGGTGLGMRGGHGGALEHLGNFRLGERFGQDFPGLGRLDVDGGVVMDAAVEEEPLVEAAQAAELARGGAGVDAVGAEVLEETGDVLLDGGEQGCVAAFKKLGEGVEVAGVGFAGERPQAFLDAHVVPIVLE